MLDVSEFQKRIVDINLQLNELKKVISNANLSNAQDRMIIINSIRQAQFLFNLEHDE